MLVTEYANYIVKPNQKILHVIPRQNLNAVLFSIQCESLIQHPQTELDGTYRLLTSEEEEVERAHKFCKMRGRMQQGVRRQFRVLSNDIAVRNLMPCMVTDNFDVFSSLGLCLHVVDPVFPRATRKLKKCYREIGTLLTRPLFIHFSLLP